VLHETAIKKWVRKLYNKETSYKTILYNSRSEKTKPCGAIRFNLGGRIAQSAAQLGLQQHLQMCMPHENFPYKKWFPIHVPYSTKCQLNQLVSLSKNCSRILQQLCLSPHLFPQDSIHHPTIYVK